MIGIIQRRSPNVTSGEPTRYWHRTLGADGLGNVPRSPNVSTTAVRRKRRADPRAPGDVTGTQWTAAMPCPDVDNGYVRAEGVQEPGNVGVVAGHHVGVLPAHCSRSARVLETDTRQPRAVTTVFTY
jgi:hypothetical protein